MRNLQLTLGLVIKDLKIQLQASNDEAFSLKRPINRVEVGSSSSSSSYSFACWKTFECFDAVNDSIYQVDIDFGRIESSSCPPNGVWPNFDLRIQDKHEAVLILLLKEMRQWSGLDKFSDKKYRPALSSALANLFESYFSRKQLLINMRNDHYVHPSNNSDHISNKCFSKVIKFLDESSYIQLVLGQNNEFNYQSSWCTPRSLLISLFDKSRMSTMINMNASMISIRNKPIKTGRLFSKVAGEEIIFPPSSREIQRIKLLEPSIRDYNQIWLRNIATLDGSYIQPWLKRIFIQDTSLGGRFYGRFQNLPQNDRRRILINNEQTVELDFKSLHIAILYAQECIQLELDPYVIKGFSRDSIKQVFLRLTNTNDLASLKRQITISGDPAKQIEYQEIKDRVDIYNHFRARGIRVSKPKVPLWFDRFIENLPVNVKGEELLNVIFLKHAPIAHRFGEADIGLKLQRIDSSIIERIISKLHGMPILPVHDSIICQRSNKQMVKQAMLEAAYEVLNVRLMVK